ncbi:protein-glutamine gamma-glutamyltransferase K-like [Gigantopelta aegis]|uniref:protein-glutamine gamma-glutamyltransferase K-like n=1 Tax=Gigantopelta aegis TaxID=1735272 RepID=UPI001B88BF44|nr:protein-glutamine gamma-glutamyltransferase K-like [Gigantopelta aegis]XP_041375253.1 protein-glutamine gamma-glutamyltransferase K-like [Gigantopelta aegis]XP_041375254.1 protein-glutamine gamma-glutamyltransferase K-like [Gigantopelta aegis]XP_041375255.1 protein-glutamine gamma-glutamyltransferase K-like [Gigantopelta aegis]
MARTRRTRRRESGEESRPTPPRRHRYNLRSRSRRLKLLGGDQEGRRPTISDEEFRKKIKSLIVVEQPKTLKVSSVDLHKDDNQEAHHTSEYEIEDLVIRRGQGFDVSITFDRPNTDTDVIILQFSTGPRPQESKGTLIQVPVKSKPDGPRRWTAASFSADGKTVKVKVVPAANAIVGQYRVHVVTKCSGSESKLLTRFELPDEDIYVIFNPWCRDDDVYLADVESREEYVLNDHGAIWIGSARNNAPRPWNFGQFDDPCLDAALILLDRAELGDSARRSPVAITRTLTAQTNSMDDNGVLQGRWTDTYPKNCTVPWAWTGSVAILRQFVKSGKPVKFGQCWVFSGLTTTILRSLGIPTRSVTNFESAHDTDCSMTIDFHFDDDDEPCTWLDDSIWNFHVWNECWFKRPDLPEGYGGWQAVDATPQEVSEGVMQCGPASVKAIKEGHVYLKYDTGFIFGEVNGDKVTWEVAEDGTMEVIGIDTRHVGRCISTKSRGSCARDNVTNHYKYPDGCHEERRVAAFVNRFSSRADEDIYRRRVSEDVTFVLDVPDSASVTDDLVITVTMRNTADDTRHVRGRVSVLSSFYTGIPAKRLKGELDEFEIQSKQQKKVVLTLTTQEFQSKLNPEAAFQTYACYKVKETGQHFAKQEAFSLVRPPLVIIIPEKVPVKEETEAKVIFKNPLQVDLTNGVIHIEGSTIVGSDIYEHKKPIHPDETVEFVFVLNPRRHGRREIDATFSSDQLCGIDGSAQFLVE